jgi:hypothetical protein
MNKNSSVATVYEKAIKQIDEYSKLIEAIKEQRYYEQDKLSSWFDEMNEFFSRTEKLLDKTSEEENPVLDALEDRLSEFDKELESLRTMIATLSIDHVIPNFSLGDKDLLHEEDGKEDYDSDCVDDEEVDFCECYIGENNDDEDIYCDSNDFDKEDYVLFEEDTIY